MSDAVQRPEGRMVKILEPILTPTLRPTARMAQQAEVGLHVNEMLTRRSTCRALTALWAKGSSASSRTRALRSILTIREGQASTGRRFHPLDDGGPESMVRLARRAGECPSGHAPALAPPRIPAWSKNSCGLAVIILQEAAQSLLAAHAALTAADNFLIPRKQ